MGLFGGGKSAGYYRRKEAARLKAIRKQAQQKEVWQTTEGKGIAEEANISLGYDTDLEEEDDYDMRDMSGAGLMI
jgi:hypothetical protein